MVVMSALLLGAGGAAPVASPPAELSFTADGRMNFPAEYRQWVYLTSGLGMSYTASAPTHPNFDNVFVNPSSYKSFLATGTWPDKTALVLEGRRSVAHASIDAHGSSQSTEVLGVEVHVKDSRLPGGWGFFSFDDDHKPVAVMARPASCYTCHEAHAAVDTTFVQFYPTLIGVATEKGTLGAGYLKEMAGAKP
jgi:hypothetical protein